MPRPLTGRTVSETAFEDASKVRWLFEVVVDPANRPSAMGPQEFLAMLLERDDRLHGLSGLEEPTVLHLAIKLATHPELLPVEVNTSVDITEVVAKLALKVGHRQPKVSDEHP